MEVVVHKYGGSSLATLDKVRRVADRIGAAYRATGPLVVVVSARGNTTDELLRLAKEAGVSGSGRETDQLLATGECASAATMAIMLESIGVPAVSLTGNQARISTSGSHGAGVVEEVATERIVGHLDAGTTAVVTGFQGLNAAGDITTLGRGGSDTTAVALAVALGARQCEIYTDVEGVHTGDPRVVDTARVLPSVDLSVMAEMAFTGAKVLHPRAVELAGEHDVSLCVRGSFCDNRGTEVVTGRETGMIESKDGVVAITQDLDVVRALVHARGQENLAAEVLSLLGSRSIPIDLVARSGPYEEEFRMGFTMRESDFGEVEEPLRRVVADFGGAVRADAAVGKLSLVGMGLLNRPDSTARMLSTLTSAGIPTSWLATSQLRTSVIVPIGHAARAVELLHDEFGLADTTTQTADGRPDHVEAGAARPKG